MLAHARGSRFAYEILAIIVPCIAVVINCMTGSSESWGLNSTHFRATHVPVEEPSTASQAD